MNRHISPAASDNARQWDHNAGTHHPRCPAHLVLLSPKGECPLADETCQEKP